MQNKKKGYRPCGFSILSFVVGCLIIFPPLNSAAAPINQGNDWFVAAPQSEVIRIARYYENFLFDPSIGNNHEISDDYRIFPFYLDQPSIISVEVFNANTKEVSSLIAPQQLNKGSHYFVLSYEDIAALGVEHKFSIKIKGNLVQGNKTSRVLAQFNSVLTHYNRGEILGQLMRYEVMVERGQLRLSRDDLRLEGRGPDFTFSRSYSNQAPDEESGSTLGRGWSHNHFIGISAVAHGSMTTPYNLPAWVLAQKLSFNHFDQLLDSDGPFQVMYLSNGGPFKKIDNKWIPQMGHHGRLVEEDNSFVFISKDGTKYRFNTPRRLPIPDPKQWFDNEGIDSDVSPDHLYGRASQALIQDIRDHNGNTVTYRYVNTYYGPLLTNITDAVKRELNFVYQKRETGGYLASTPYRLIKVIGPDNILLELTYDTNGYHTAFQRGNLIEKYEYQIENTALQNEATYNLFKIIDGNNHTTIYGYLASDNVPDYLTQKYPGIGMHDVVETITYPDGAMAKIEYDNKNSNKRTLFDFRANPTVYTFNKSGNPTRIIEPIGSETHFTWGPDVGLTDLVKVSQRINNGERFYQYDKQGNVTEEIDSDGSFERSTWNQMFSELEERIWENGSRYVAEYDNRGNQVKEITADNVETLFEYNQFGELTERRLVGGAKMKYSYDQWGLLQMESNVKGVEVYENDIRGRVVKIDSFNGTTTKKKYDALDRLIWSQTGSVITTYKYDVEGNVIFEDNGAVQLWYTYDERDRVVAVVTSDGKEEKYTYDANSNRLVFERKNSVTRRQQYDAEDNEVIPSLARKQYGHAYHKGR